MPAKLTANNAKKGNRKVNVANLKPWPKGVSGNPAGAPKRGESWAEIIQRIGEMTDAEFVKLKHDNPTQKQQAIMAIYMALKNDPQPGVFNAIMERVEGKVTQPVDVRDWRKELETNGIDASAAFEQLVAAIAASRKPDVAGSGGGSAA